MAMFYKYLTLIYHSSFYHGLIIDLMGILGQSFGVSIELWIYMWDISKMLQFFGSFKNISSLVINWILYFKIFD